MPLVVVDEVDSTNRLARRVAELDLAEGRPASRLIVLARAQTAGRGRRGRHWASPGGRGIYTSLLLPIEGGEALAALPLVVPLALCEGLDPLGAGCAIKWPNDLMVGERKLGGVLIESLGGRAAIVGYGVNGSQGADDLPAPAATSLRLATGAAPDLSALAVDLALAVLERLERAESAAQVVAAYRRRSGHRPGEPLRCRLGDEEIHGRFAGFDERGLLRLETATGERRFGSAELLAEANGVAPATDRREGLP